MHPNILDATRMRRLDMRFQLCDGLTKIVIARSYCITFKTGYSRLYSIAESKSERRASERNTFFLRLGMATPRCLQHIRRRLDAMGLALGEERFEWFPCSGSSEMGTTVYSTTSPAAFIESVAFH